jgi:hypothetical protein
MSGKLRGLLDVRDNVLVGIGEELGTMAQTLSLAFNAQHNANAVFPPPTELSGRQTAAGHGCAEFYRRNEYRHRRLERQSAAQDLGRFWRRNAVR